MRVKMQRFLRATQTLLIGPHRIYSAIWSLFEGFAHFTYCGPQKPDQSSVHFKFRPSSWQLRKCGNVSSPASKLQKSQHNSLWNTFNLFVRFTAGEAGSHLTASIITCDEMSSSMSSWCNIHSISVQIKKYSFKYKGWWELFLLFSWVLFQIKTWRSFCCK